MPVCARPSLAAGLALSLVACAQPAPAPVAVAQPSGSEVVAAAPAAPSAIARVRVIHASPDPLAAHVAVYLDNSTTAVIPNLGYRTGVGYEAIGAGVHVVQARFPSAPPTSPPVLSYNTPNFQEGRWYTVVAHGLASEPQGPPVGFSPEEDPGAPVDPSRAALRLFHAVVGGPAVDICVGGAPALAGVAYGQWSNGASGRYAAVNPGAQQVVVRQHGGAPCSGRALGGFQANLAPGTNYTVVAIGRVGRIGAVTLEALICNDAPLTAPSQCAAAPLTPM